MGCACIQQDPVVKNQRINKDQRSSNINSGVPSNNPNSRAQGTPVNEGVTNRQNIQNRIEPSQRVNNRPNINRNINIQTYNLNPNPVLNILGDIYLQSKNNPNFNYQEIGKILIILEGIFSGTGLRMMKGYNCPHSKEDLVRKRNEFWSNLVLNFRHKNGR
jgi:hypothetical protein